MTVPSWLRWPPNCCETCTGPWMKVGDWEGTCGKSSSVNYGDRTDARFRCQDFERKENDKTPEINKFQESSLHVECEDHAGEGEWNDGQYGASEERQEADSQGSQG